MNCEFQYTFTTFLDRTHVLKTLRGFTNVDVCTKVESLQFRIINALPRNVFNTMLPIFLFFYYFRCKYFSIS